MQSTQNIHVREIVPIISPQTLLDALPMTEAANRTVVTAREGVKKILQDNDPHLLVIVGPCSIHDEKIALEYAEKLSALSQEVQDRLLIIMRVYFEKPRTTIGWKGLINDPYLNGTFDIDAGLHLARRILLRITEMGLPAGTEMLDPITPQYVADLVSWASLGARTIESQTHRQMASGLSMPVGYKNATDGNLQLAIDAMQSARNPHSFIGIDSDGKTCVVHTTGNPLGHLILRGGRSGPNYYVDKIEAAAESLMEAGLPANIMVDCSHANSRKDFRKQERVWHDVIRQRTAGNTSIIGLMLESNLNEGRQNRVPDVSQLEYGVSITDACIGWSKTEELIQSAYKAMEGMA